MDDGQENARSGGGGRGGRRCARAGDVVVIHEKYDALSTVTLRNGAFVDNRYGRFAHDDVLGRAVGRAWRSTRGERFVHAVRPWTQLMAYAMTHRTQVVYPHDAFVICAFLGLQPGMTVVECGTGSGAAALALATAVAPHGRVLSFEFHAQRAASAAALLCTLRLEHVVRVHGGVDVVQDGFNGVRDAQVDALLLDVPAPFD
ncbi:unnamed protein product, partial [Agarophyton chilense]